MLIHPSQQSEARRALFGAGLLLAAAVVIYSLPVWLRGASVPEYLPIHMGLETLSIVVSGLIFGVVWSVRREGVPASYVMLGAAFLGAGLLDFTHMLSARGMPAFVTPSSSDKAIYFWLAARSLGALALLGAAWLPVRPAGRWSAYVWTACIAVLVLGLHALYFTHPEVFTGLFVQDHGLTRVKVVYEYTLMAIYLVTAARLGWCMRQPRSFNAGGLFAAVCIMAEGGVFFAGYTSVNSVYILAGHFYKAIAYLFLFHAVFAETVRRPYRMLRDSRQQLQATLDALPDLLFELDADGRYLEVHANNPESLADVAGHLLGKTVRETLSAQDAAVCMDALQEAAREGSSRGKVVGVDALAGERRWFELSVSRKTSPSGPEQRFVMISRDVTTRRHAEQTLLNLSSAVSQDPVAIVITDLAGGIEYINPAFSRISGYAEDEAVGRNVETLLRSGKTPDGIHRELWDRLRQGQSWRGELVNRSKSGAEYVVSALIYPLRNHDGEVTHFISHQQDITEQKQTAERIRQLSHFDQLTGLPNRGQLHEQFRRTHAQGGSLALLWIDLDRFKDVNDSLGHAAGDQLLQEVAKRLHASVGADCLLSRQSGDEFVVIVPGADQSVAAALAQSLLHALAQPLDVMGQDFFVTVSIGIALCPGDGEQLDVLLKSAEIAMYRAKEDGRNDYCFFAVDMQQRAVRALALGNALKQACERNELHLLYQPQIELAGNGVVGVEALLRWNSPQWGAVSPAEFIPVVEANGLIVPIGDWVLRTALRQLHGWLERGLPMPTVAVNLSAVQFNQPGIAERIGSLVKQAGVPPECLELELTEAVAMKAPELAARTIDELGRQSIRLAIDDFGTGYSSLSYLKQFNINKIKIDQSFVRDIGVDPNDQAIVSAVIQMAHGLGMRTIAEGVETEEQLAFLREHGCDEAQGYLFGRPMQAEQIEAFVHGRLANASGGDGAARVA